MAESRIKDVPVPVDRFSDLTNIHASLKNSIIRGFRYETLSLVQKQVLTLSPEQRHKDLFIKSKTGSGKTLAFLIPAIQNALENMTEQEAGKGVNVQVLVISPTRELAKQIGDEATRLISNAPGLKMGVQVVVGGESRNRNLWNLRQRRADIFVGTPGRLKDLLDEPELKQAISSLKTLVLDEADTLLEMGFKKELDAILHALPRKRRSLMVSATVNSEIRAIANRTLQGDHLFLDCTDPNAPPETIPSTINHTYVTAPMADQPAVLRNIMIEHQKRTANGGKIMVFFPTTRGTVLYSELFRSMGLTRLYELHSRLTQNQRTYTSMRFRRDKHFSVLFTSDVSARGIDYPDVSLVIQMGAPASVDQYVHRTGRTGRAGKEGRSMLVLDKFEGAMIRDISRLGAKADELQAAIDAGEFIGEKEHKQVTKAARALETGSIQQAFSAFLGYYAGRGDKLGFYKFRLPEYAKEFIKPFLQPGEEDRVDVSPKLLAKLGLLAPRGYREKPRDDSRYEKWYLDEETEERTKDERLEWFDSRTRRKREKKLGGRYEPKNIGTPEYLRHRNYSAQHSAETSKRRPYLRQKTEKAWYDE